MNLKEIEILKFFDRYGTQSQTLVLAFSGGRDSVVLLEIMRQVAPRRNIRLVMGHVHHGPSEDKTLQESRDRAREFSRKTAEQYGFDFLLEQNQSEVLKSEEELRDFRHKAFKKWCQSDGANVYVLLAHHAQDLLETRLMRLLRGTGPEGLTAMREADGHLLRPLLRWEIQDLEGYAKQKNLEWCEDPSNRDVAYFRNFLRNQWLPLIETSRSGSVKNLALSLERLAESLEAAKSETTQLSGYNEAGLDRVRLMQLDLVRQKQTVANYLSSLGLSFSANHVGEILKRLDSGQKELTFSLLKRTWRVDTERIYPI